MSAFGRIAAFAALCVLAAPIQNSEAIAQEVLQLGSCPAPLAIQREGMWASASQLPPDKQAALSANAAAGGHPMVATYLDMARHAIATITYDTRLDSGQGSYTPATLQQIAKGYAPNGVKEHIKAFSDAAGKSFPIETYDDSSLMSVSDHVFYVVDANSTPDQGAFYWVQGWAVVDGCVVELRFTFPIVNYNFADTIPYAKQIVLSGVTK